jgi:hypothetical protein
MMLTLAASKFKEHIMTESYSSDKNNPNATGHYVTITIAVVIGMIGVLLRFLGKWPYIDAVSNVILIIGVVIALKAVSDILK